MLSLDAIKAAQRTIRPYAIRTPLRPALSLSDSSREVRLKLETTQPTGAFKLRGAVNALSRLSRRQRERGVVCASTGNHGRALAYAASQLGSQATICVSSLVPRNKLEAIRALGADVRVHGNSQDEAHQLVERLVNERELTEIPPFDHLDVMAGQGTIGIEILEDWPEVDTLIMGISGGGLASGVAAAARAINPSIRIIGVSPVRGAAMAASLEAGQPVDVEELPTLADSLGGGIGLDNRYTFAHVRALVDELVLLEEAQIAAAMRHLFYEEQLVTEGAGAAGVAVVMDKVLRAGLNTLPGERIAVVISGGNVDMREFLALMKSG